MSHAVPPERESRSRKDLSSLVFGDLELEEARWLISRALLEDLPQGDVTTDSLFGAGGLGGPRAGMEGAFLSRAPGVLCGLPVVREIFRTESPDAELEPCLDDGDRLEPGEPFLIVRGPARSILRVERVALNFLQRLSGIATHTRRWVDGLRGSGIRLLDTRKTTPAWRHLEKYAVRAGGGENHRGSLSDAILLKDNHEGVLRALGRSDIAEWVRSLRQARPGLFLEVEVATREELLRALETEADAILLDNFKVEDIRWAVEKRNRRDRKRPLLEASGGLRLDGLAEIRGTGVDRVSVGSLTHSSAAIDMTLDVIKVHEGES